MFRSMYFTLAFILVNYLAEGQGIKNSLSGTVTDAKTGKPLVGASIIITDLKTGAYTNDYGVYQVNNISLGQHLIEVSYVGYSSLSEYINVTQVTRKDFQLQSQAFPV